jgi:hypothetical protein
LAVQLPGRNLGFLENGKMGSEGGTGLEGKDVIFSSDNTSSPVASSPLSVMFWFTFYLQDSDVGGKIISLLSWKIMAWNTVLIS